MAETTVYFNPSCSKCRTARGILHSYRVDANFVRYLEEPPTIADLSQLMALLGIDDPRQMMRRGEPTYSGLRLDVAGREQLLEAIVDHPILLERPIVVRGQRAVIARPPERVFELFPELSSDAIG